MSETLPPERSSSESEDSLAAPQDVPELSRKLVQEVGIAPEQAEQAVRLVQSYSGPIPPAAELNRYNLISPNLGTRIAEDYLEGRQHDRAYDLAAIDLARRDSARKDNWIKYATRGLNFGFISQFAFIVGAFVAMFSGHLLLAGAFISPPAFGAIGKFIQGFQHKVRDDQD